MYRYLAHATIGGAEKAVPNIPDAYPAFGALTAAAHSNQQALQQLATRLDHFVKSDPHIRHDGGDDSEGNRAAMALVDATEHLQAAARTACQIGADLSHACGQLSHVYHEEAEITDLATAQDGE